jgi:hypothetical protein
MNRFGITPFAPNVSAAAAMDMFALGIGLTVQVLVMIAHVPAKD